MSQFFICTDMNCCSQHSPFSQGDGSQRSSACSCQQRSQSRRRTGRERGAPGRLGTCEGAKQNQRATALREMRAVEGRSVRQLAEAETKRTPAQRARQHRTVEVESDDTVANAPAV